MMHFENRDREFLAAFENQSAKLDHYFHRELKEAARQGIIPKLELIAQKQELLRKTALKAFMNSRRESCSTYTIERLIWLKAKNVLIDHLNANWKQIDECTPDAPTEERSQDRDPFQSLDNKEKLINIYKEADKYSNDMRIILEMMYNGLLYKEIAAALNTSEAAIKMKVSRFKRWLHKQPKK
ncbi:hypothetical protein SAMN04488505_102744 [Chitinophaga rupis]|uniref:RNA polymerase sigma factor, sigma-70 family n=1 Tax=Chitinophaga rupis TaxID=573321 RepID=A0A1H7RW32_9BACT|nr:sigma-70 family RNA polymerase sigma factor [Chitinophaga rupis]SEL64229.1 hypothetical protein SAMN04488505_102744 [Chitinophaga rupis]